MEANIHKTEQVVALAEKKYRFRHDILRNLIYIKPVGTDLWEPLADKRIEKLYREVNASIKSVGMQSMLYLIGSLAPYAVHT